MKSKKPPHPKKVKRPVNQNIWHEHPLRILRYSFRSLWLLIFPLLRGISVLRLNELEIDRESLYLWLRGAWQDILILGAIIIFGLIRWNCTRVELSGGSVIYREGVLVRLRTSIPLESISVITAENPLYLMPVRGVRLSIDTRAGIFKTTDLKLLMKRKYSDEMLSRLPDIDIRRSTGDISDPSGLSVLLFSLFFSSGFSGTVYIATFFFKGGDIAHDIITLYLSRITETTERLTSNFILKIPCAALAAGTFFISAWLLSFFVNIQRYSRFRISSDDRYLRVTCGLFNRRSYRISLGHINYTDLRQNLIMKLAGVVSVSISCAGYGTSSQHLPVLMPMKLEKNLGKGLERLGVFSGVKLNFRPVRTALYSYIYIPVYAALALLPASDKLAQFFPQFAELIRFAGIMLEIPAVWMVAVRTAALYTSGISLYSDKILISCSKWNTFHTIAADRESIVKLEISQSLYQKYISHRCSLIFWFCGEGSSRYCINSMRLRDAVEISSVLGFGNAAVRKVPKKRRKAE